MNKRINELYKQAHIEHRQEYFSSVVDPTITSVYVTRQFNYELFAKLIISEVLDEVNERAYYCGDRAWSDDEDRKWIELEFGFGELADKQNERKNQRTR